MRDIQERVGKHPIAQLIGYMNKVVMNLICDDARQQGWRPEPVSLDGSGGEDDGGASLVEVLADVETDVAEESLVSDERAALRRVVR